MFKLKFPTGEFDMVVVDRASQEVELYEVKHATMRDDRQLRHLADGMKVAEVERLYGRVVARTVLYRGQPAELPNGIRYRNVGEYLRSVFGKFGKKVCPSAIYLWGDCLGRIKRHTV